MKYKIGKDLEVVQVKERGKFIVVVTLFSIMVGSILFLSTRQQQVKIINKYWVSDTEPKDIELSDSAIVNCLHENGCVLPNIALAQAKLESNLGKSKVGKNAKNMFGITYHKCKYVDGKHGVYAKYKTYKDNIKCYIHIQDRYLQNINGVYATDPTYITKIKQMK